MIFTCNTTNFHFIFIQFYFDQPCKTTLFLRNIKTTSYSKINRGELCFLKNMTL